MQTVSTRIWQPQVWLVVAESQKNLELQIIGLNLNMDAGVSGDREIVGETGTEWDRDKDSEWDSKAKTLPITFLYWKQ